MDFSITSIFISVIAYMKICYSLETGESIRTIEGDRKQNGCSWAKDGLGILYFTAWLLLHGF